MLPLTEMGRWVVGESGIRCLQPSEAGMLGSGCKYDLRVFSGRVVGRA